MPRKHGEEVKKAGGKNFKEVCKRDNYRNYGVNGGGRIGQDNMEEKSETIPATPDDGKRPRRRGMRDVLPL